jgi:hypothetical protein
MTRTRKIAFALAFALAVALLGSACIGSLQKVFRAKDVVNMKKLGGLWTVAKYGDIKDADLPDKPWVFRAAEAADTPAWWVDVSDEEDRPATLEAVFFRVGEELYVQSRVKKSPQNNLAVLHRVPLRVPSRVRVEKGRLSFYPLHRKQLEKLAGKELGLREVGDHVLLDADAEAWHRALTKHGAKLFDGDPLIVLERTRR